MYGLSISSLTAEDAGNYTCTANNTLVPAIASATISLTVNSKFDCSHDELNQVYFFFC